MAEAAMLGLQAVTSIAEGVMQSSADRAQARADDFNANQSLLQGAYNETTIRDRARASMGEAIASSAANGVALQGSALDALWQSAKNREAAVLDARYSAANEAYGYQVKAAQERQAAKFAVLDGVLRAGTQTLSGTSSMNNAASVRAAQTQSYGGMRLPGASGIYGG